MSTRSFSFFNRISLINDIGSEKIGFYFSFFLHIIVLIFIIGMPNLFKPPSINIPNVIPIEIVNVSDTTLLPKEIEQNQNKVITKEKTYENLKPKKFNNIETELVKKPKKFNNIETELVEKTKKLNSVEPELVKKPKKFNSAEPELIKKIELKNKPEQNTKKNKLFIEEKKIEKNIKDKIELDNNQKIKEKDNLENLPSKKIKPKIKPQQINEELTTLETSDIVIKSKPKPQTNFNIASMLKDLRNDQQSIQKKQSKELKAQDEKKLNKKEERNNERAQLSISEIDLLIQQLSMCWSAPAGAVIKKGMVVKISAKIKSNRMVFQDSIRIIDTNIPKNDPFFGPITESAMRTLLNPECNPLKLPLDKYDLWKSLTINFDHSIMKGYQ